MATAQLVQLLTVKTSHFWCAASRLMNRYVFISCWTHHLGRDIPKALNCFHVRYPYLGNVCTVKGCMTEALLPTGQGILQNELVHYKKCYPNCFKIPCLWTAITLTVWWSHCFTPPLIQSRSQTSNKRYGHTGQLCTYMVAHVAGGPATFWDYGLGSTAEIMGWQIM